MQKQAFPISFSDLICAPIFAPIYAAGMTGIVYSHGTFPSDICVTELTRADKRTMNIEVPTATCGGKRKSKIIAGTRMEPPPIPKRPEENPTKNVNNKANQIGYP